MSNKVYRVNKNNELVSSKKGDLVQFIVGIFVYACVLSIASSLFEGLEISSFGYSLIAALILSGLNYLLKPILVYLTLPITILTFGLLYPLTNMIIIYICSLIMGSNFIISGFIDTFFIVLFISLFKMFLDVMITKKVG